MHLEWQTYHELLPHIPQTCGRPYFKCRSWIATALNESIRHWHIMSLGMRLMNIVMVFITCRYWDFPHHTWNSLFWGLKTPVLLLQATTTQSYRCSELQPPLRAPAAQSCRCSELQLPLRTPAAQMSYHTQLPPLRTPAAQSYHCSELLLLTTSAAQSSSHHCSELRSPATHSCHRSELQLLRYLSLHLSVTLFTKYAHKAARCSHCSEMICSSETLLLPTIGNLNPPCFAYGPEVAM